MSVYAKRRIASVLLLVLFGCFLVIGFFRLPYEIPMMLVSYLATMKRCHLCDGDLTTVS